MPEEEEKEKEMEEMLEVIMVENFPKLITDINTQIQLAQRKPNK